jgi:hypothetical protein
MAKQTSIIGNLALKPAWDRLSETEPDCSFELESKTAPSRSMHRKRAALTSAREKVVGLRPATHFLIGTPSSSERSPDLFEMAGIVVGGPISDEGINVAASIPDDIPLVVEDIAHNVYLASAEGESRLISFLIGREFTESFWGSVPPADEQTGACTASLTGSFQILIRESEDQSVDTFDTLISKIRGLHEEFAQWPGSYNQLLLAGSLDYCRSALIRAKRNRIAVHEEVTKSIRGYYADCLGILDQYLDAKSALRRLNLQKIQDKFEILQDTCSRHGIYPRLAELDISDVPRE